MNSRLKITLSYFVVAAIIMAGCAIMLFNVVMQRQQHNFVRKNTSDFLSMVGRFAKAEDPKNLSWSENLTFDDGTLVKIFDDQLRPVGDINFDSKFSGSELLETILKEPVNQVETRLPGKNNFANYTYLEKQGKRYLIVLATHDSEAASLSRSLIKLITISFLLASLFVFAFGWWLSARWFSPLHRIVEQVENIDTAQLSERMPSAGLKGEWQKMSNAFNGLLARLQNSFDMQGRFISNASHEMSTPLTSVTNQIDVALRKPRENEVYVAVLRSVQADVMHMSALTQQLLQLARTARGGALSTEEVRVDELLMELPALLKKVQSTFKVSLHFDELPDDEASCVVNGNAELLSASFKNLGENGCKYATDRIVHISLAFEKNHVLMRFENTYGDFSEADIENIFQPFERGTAATHEQGYGLGLSLTRRIVLLHKGSITARLQPGKIFCVEVILPSAAV